MFASRLRRRLVVRSGRFSAKVRRGAFEFLEPRQLLAATYYVDPAGLGGLPDNANSGAVDHPLATVQAAIDRAGPGDTVILRGGLYSVPANPIEITRGGAPGAPLTIRAAEGEHPILDLAEWRHWQQDPHGWWYVDLPADSVTEVTPDLASVQIRDGWAASRISGAAVAGGPPAAFSSPPAVYLQGGKLAYDLSWYDHASRRMWFRSNEIQPITDPDRQCGIISPAGWQCQFHASGASWLVIDGLEIQNGWFGIHLDSGDHNVVRNCRVEHCWSQGILVLDSFSEIAGNYVDYVGGQLSDKGSLGIRRDWLYHGLYVTGEGLRIHDNFFGRALSGSSAQLTIADDATATTVFSNNVCYGAQTYGVCVEGRNVSVTGNVAIGPQLVWRGSRPESPDADSQATGLVYYGTVGNITVSGNYLEAPGYGVWVWGTAGQSMPDTVLADSTIVGGASDARFTGLPSLTGANHWGGNLMFDLPGGRTDYAGFLAWARAGGWEQISSGGATTFINPAPFDAQLDAQPTREEAMRIFREYAAGQMNALAGLPAGTATVLGGTATADVSGVSPQAISHQYALNAGTALSADAGRGLLAGDSDPNGGVLRAAVATGPANGYVTFQADGSFNYTPNPGFQGSDGFTYQIQDGQGGTALAAVTLTVLPPGGDLTVPNGASITLGSGMTTAVRLRRLTIAGGAQPVGTLDLADGQLVIDGTANSIATVAAQIASAWNPADPKNPWKGPGITSSSAAVGAERYAVGYARNGDFGELAWNQWFGRPADDDSILVRYTYAGDADLNGEVMTDDFDLWKQGFLKRLSGWMHGDLDYSGSVTTDDFDLWKQVYVKHYAPLANGAGGAGGASQVASAVIAPQPAPATTATLPAATLPPSHGVVMEEFDWLSGAACFASLSPGTASGSGGSSSKPTEDSVDLLLAQWAV